MKYYFQGRKDLFEGLSIAELEKDWKQYPVLHFDMSACKNKYEIGQIIEELHSQLDYHEEKYGMAKTVGSPGTRFKKIIQCLHKEIGLKTVVILDEYDAPLLDYLHKPDELEQVRRIMQERVHHGHHQVQPTQHLLHFEQSAQYLHDAPILGTLRHHH